MLMKGKVTLRQARKSAVCRKESHRDSRKIHVLPLDTVDRPRSAGSGQNTARTAVWIGIRVQPRRRTTTGIFDAAGTTIDYGKGYLVFPYDNPRGRAGGASLSTT